MPHDGFDGERNADAAAEDRADGDDREDILRAVAKKQARSKTPAKPVGLFEKQFSNGFLSRSSFEVACEHLNIRRAARDIVRYLLEHKGRASVDFFQNHPECFPVPYPKNVIRDAFTVVVMRFTKLYYKASFEIIYGVRSRELVGRIHPDVRDHNVQNLKVKRTLRGYNASAAVRDVRQRLRAAEALADSSVLPPEDDEGEI